MGIICFIYLKFSKISFGEELRNSLKENLVQRAYILRRGLKGVDIFFSSSFGVMGAASLKANFYPNHLIHFRHSRNVGRADAWKDPFIKSEFV